MNPTKNAKRLINIIALEVMLANKRAQDGHIGHTQVSGCILERLQAKAKRDVDLMTFLTTMSVIPKDEDESDEVDWAKDRREPRAHVVTDGEDEEAAWPTPGQRIC